GVQAIERIQQFDPVPHLLRRTLVVFDRLLALAQPLLASLRCPNPKPGGNLGVEDFASLVLQCLRGSLPRARQLGETLHLIVEGPRLRCLPGGTQDRPERRSLILELSLLNL